MKAKEAKTVMANINTSKVPFLFSGLYNSIWESFLDFDDEMDLIENNDYSDEEIEEYKKEIDNCLRGTFDSNKALTDIGGYIAEEFNSSLYFCDNCIELLEVSSTFSPKYYNFSTDSIEFTAMVNPDVVIESLNYFIEEHKEIIEEYHKNNWESRSGFISFMPTMNDIYKYIKQYDFNSDVISDNEMFDDIVCFFLCVYHEIYDEYSEYNSLENFIGNNSPYNYYNVETEAE